MVPILTNKDVLEPSYKNKKFMVQIHNYFFTNLNISQMALMVKKKKKIVLRDMMNF